VYSDLLSDDFANEISVTFTVRDELLNDNN